jgi:hypothetical protein
MTVDTTTELKRSGLEASPAKSARERISGILFWAFALAALLLAVGAILKVADVQRQLSSARSETVAAEARLADFQRRLETAEGDVDRLCKTAQAVERTIALPENARARAELGDGFLNQTGLVKSIACKVDAAKEK